MEYDVNPDYTLSKKRENGLYLSDEMVEVLEEFEIDYLKCKTLKELIRAIEEAQEENDDDSLDNLLSILSERDDYENFKK